MSQKSVNAIDPSIHRINAPGFASSVSNATGVCATGPRRITPVISAITSREVISPSGSPFRTPVHVTIPPGSVPQGTVGTHQLFVINRSSELPDDVRLVSLSSAVTSPDGPHTVPGSDSLPVDIEVSAGDPGEHFAHLVLMSAAPCQEPDTLVVLWRVPGGRWWDRYR